MFLKRVVVVHAGMKPAATSPLQRIRSRRLYACALIVALVSSISAAALHAADSPLADAAMRGDRDGVRSLLKQKVEVNAPQGDGTSCMASSKGYKHDNLH